MSEIPPDWLARYVTRTGIVIHPLILKDIEHRRGIPYPDSLLTYFSENRDGDDWKRISNAWRQKRHRDQRSNTLEALRNDKAKVETQALRNDYHVVYDRVMDEFRRKDIGIILDMIFGIHAHGCPANTKGIDRADHAMDILRQLRNAIDQEMIDMEKHKVELQHYEALRNAQDQEEVIDRQANLA